MGQSMILSHVEHGKEMEKEKKKWNQVDRLHKDIQDFIIITNARRQRYGLLN